ncbi:amino acid deaminase [Bordetella avium]|uniref:D-serine deaminase n=1 Tax=Bordetella avium (strain 197N) TaxID=360910 RepID=Q2KWE3_BORA1|nr:amino acid deaminase [Bordetella avium]AZY50026.1 amino acid deaminase [Bordetella avium]AZY53391.1 amino acid deaminase [Bordetella avium]RIQ13015.1 amino acid deaminase [Bordetella avium]RIQ37577.1 amino acid deaminase [Bordetella avium]RIQ42294.1 amino acid deaminase [Bordetella avium]
MPTATPLDPDGKGLGLFPEGAITAQAAGLGWNLLREEVSLPVAVLYESRVRHNLRWMQQFMEAYQVKLAPHGKTTMSPALFARQIEAGAWGITLATAPQTLAAYHHGVRRVIMANQLVGRANMAIIAQLLRDPGFTFCCLVDSAANAAQLGAYFQERRLRLPVLLELGVAGGRTGVRDDARAQEVLAEIERWPASLALAGVEIYEGVLQEEPAIRAFARRAADTLRGLAAAGRLRDDGPAIITGAGSAWFDVVAQEFSELDIGQALDIVLRPGCYLSHDIGIYRSAAERIATHDPIARRLEPGLQAALQVWAYVQSLPEPGLAIIGLGKRDAAFDAGLPAPDRHFRPGASAPQDTPGHWKLTAMMDQHAFMSVGTQDDIAVGDMIAFGISHPCLTFDKWRQILLLDDSFNVTGVAPTYF